MVCGEGSGRSVEGARLLKAFGLKAIWLCGGIDEWLSVNG